MQFIIDARADNFSVAWYIVCINKKTYLWVFFASTIIYIYILYILFYIIAIFIETNKQNPHYYF